MSPARSRRDALVVTALALAARLVVVAWAASRFPPAADGTYYETIAERIAKGLGYTWLWPDGAVTFAAHYPVGYPALIGGFYAIFGAHVVVAMIVNAGVGALAALAAYQLGARVGRREGLLAGGLVALHPALVFYTPALMTEGVTAALLILAAAVAAKARDMRETSRFLGPIAIGVAIGVATLVRPQCLVFGPIFAWLASAPLASDPARGLFARVARRVSPTAVALAASLLVCAPWTARNCVRMNRCALVSVNGGWNLLIGADLGTTGGWSEVKVPDECREVFDEAGKDACFGAAARRSILEHPLSWLALAPKKLAATFDYVGAAPWYLHASNGAALSDRGKVVLGAVETIYERLVLVLAIVASARASGERARARLVLGALSCVFAFVLHAWLAYLGLAVVSLLRGRALFRGELLSSSAVLVLVATGATHAVFFGGGRYALVVLPFVATLAALAFRRAPAIEDPRAAAASEPS